MNLEQVTEQNINKKSMGEYRFMFTGVNQPTFTCYFCFLMVVETCGSRFAWFLKVFATVSHWKVELGSAEL